MKKLIFSLMCFFSCVSIVLANSLKEELLPYYLKVYAGSRSEKMIQIKKIIDTETNNVVFNMDPLNYETDGNFNVYSEYSSKYWRLGENVVDPFCDATYYGYNLDPSDLHYYFTQIYIYQIICGIKIEMVDERGEEINTYKDEYDKIYGTIFRHSVLPGAFNRVVDLEVWTDKKFNINTVLDYDKLEEINVSYPNSSHLVINANKAGNYELHLYKLYKRDTKAYYDGKNIYWQNIGGASDLVKAVKLNVYGTKLNIKEELHGVNNRYGDASIESNYEIYLNDELKLVTNELVNYVKSNSKYVLKDKSNSFGFTNSEDLKFEVLEDEVTVVVPKYALKKEFNVKVLDDNSYEIYLKSNNELYERIDKTIDNITLPFGQFYIKGIDNDYYYEFMVDNEDEEDLIINYIEEEKEEIKEDNKDEEKDGEEISDKEESVNEEVVVDEISNDFIEDTNDNIEEIEENPNTFDDIELSSFVVILSTIFYLILKKHFKYSQS